MSDQHGSSSSAPVSHVLGAISSEPREAAIVDAVVRAVPRVHAIYVFGSRARASHRRDSDLDLGLLLPPGAGLSADSRLRLMVDLAALAGCDVDVTVLDTSKSVVLCKEAVARGRVLHVANDAAVACFEMMTLSLYARLNEERRPVLAAYEAGPS